MIAALLHFDHRFTLCSPKMPELFYPASPKAGATTGARPLRGKIQGTIGQNHLQQATALGFVPTRTCRQLLENRTCPSSLPRGSLAAGLLYAVAGLPELFHLIFMSVPL